MRGDTRRVHKLSFYTTVHNSCMTHPKRDNILSRAGVLSIFVIPVVDLSIARSRKCTLLSLNVSTVNRRFGGSC